MAGQKAQVLWLCSCFVIGGLDDTKNNLKKRFDTVQIVLHIVVEGKKNAADPPYKSLRHNFFFADAL